MRGCFYKRKILNASKLLFCKLPKQPYPWEKVDLLSTLYSILALLLFFREEDLIV